jgi:hypothetical protein
MPAIVSVVDNGDRTYNVNFSDAVFWDLSEEPDPQWIMMDPAQGVGISDSVAIISQVGAEVIKVGGYNFSDYGNGPMILFGQPAHLTAASMFPVATPIYPITT